MLLNLHVNLRTNVHDRDTDSHNARGVGAATAHASDRLELAVQVFTCHPDATR